LEALGFGTSDTDITVDIRGEKPIGSVYKRGVDDWRFGRGFFPSQVPSYPRPRAEKEVVHRSYTGRGISTVTESISLLGMVGDEDYLSGVKLPGKFSNHQLYTKLSYDSEWHIAAPTADGVQIRNASDVVAALLDHEGDVWMVDSYPGNPHAIVIKLIFGSIEPGSLSITVSGQYRLFPFAVAPADSRPYAYVAFTETIDWTWQVPRPTDTFMHASGIYEIAGFSTVRRRLDFHEYSKHTHPYSVDPGFSGLSGLSFDRSIESPMCATSSILDPGWLITAVDNGFDSHYWLSKPDSSLDAFSRKVEADMTNLLPAVFYSASDAVMKHVSVLESNNLENFSQLSSTFELVPDVAKFISALSKGKNGDLLGSGATLLDLWAENRLREDFGWNPTVSDITELSESYESIVRVFREQGIWGERTLNGVFHYEMPFNCYGTGAVHLMARSKVRVRFDHSSLLATLIKGKSIGLIPSLGNLWDLVPFSFVADWAFNIGDRLRDIDAQAFMLMLPVHFAVHSLTLTTGLTDSQLQHLQLRPYPAGSSEFPGLKFYFRIPSLRLPILADSYYDFRAARGPSSLATAGALAYTFMKT